MTTYHLGGNLQFSALTAMRDLLTLEQDEAARRLQIPIGHLTYVEKHTMRLQPKDLRIIACRLIRPGMSAAHMLNWLEAIQAGKLDAGGGC